MKLRQIHEPEPIIKIYFPKQLKGSRRKSDQELQLTPMMSFSSFFLIAPSWPTSLRLLVQINLMRLPTTSACGVNSKITCTT